MFAIIKAGGKQYKVAKDDTIKVEKIDAKEGSSVDCEVLFGEGGQKTTVKAKVLEHKKAPKVLVFKKKRRHNYRRKRGHRQQMTVLKIMDVKAA